VIASHYAEPLDRMVAEATRLRATPGDDGAIIRELQAGECFAMLDDSLGWAWGYAGEDGRVGYLRAAALAQ
jgi:hypothetical protein